MQNQQVVKPNSDDSKVLVFGLSVIAIVFGVFFGWMAIAPLATSVVASGQISVDYNKKTLQHLEGGIIKKIIIKEGDYVEEGDPLIILDETQLRISLEAAYDQYLRSLATIARLQAQKKKTLTISFSEELEKFPQIRQEQNNILVSRVSSLKEEEVIISQRVDQLNKQIAQQNSQIESSQALLTSILEEMQDQNELVQKRLVDRQRLRELERQKIDLENRMATAKLEIVRIQSQIQETQSSLSLTRKEFDNEIDNLLFEHQARVVESSSQMNSLSDRLARSVLRAPASGYITGLDMHTIGGVINPSEAILDIVPKDTQMFVLARVATQDIDKLERGLFADLRFSAFNVQQTYVVEGVLTHISADSFVDDKTGEHYYRVRLEVTEKGKEQMIENRFFLLPGMPVDIMISVDSRTTLSYLIKPLTDMFARAFNEE